MHGHHDPRLAGRGVQRLVEAVVVADLLLRDAPRGQQHLVQHRGVTGLVRGVRSTAQARPSETTNAARVGARAGVRREGRERGLPVGDGARSRRRASAEISCEVGDGQGADRAVDRADVQRVVALVDEQGEAEVPGGVAVGGSRVAQLRLQPQVGRVAVVAVGDQRLGARPAPRRSRPARPRR